MNNNELFNKKYMTVIVLVLGVLLITLSVYSNNKTVKNEGNKFYKEYNLVSTDNVFEYKTIDEVIALMEHGTGIVFLGFPECKWCQSYVKYLNESAIEAGIDEIYYYNIKEDREKNTEEYKKIVSILEDYLQYDDSGNKRIYVPMVSFHSKGEVIGVDFETSYNTNGLDEPSEYWTDDEIVELKDKLYDLMMNIYSIKSTCTECNK